MNTYYRSREILVVAYACSLFVASIRKIETILWKILFTFASIIGINFLPITLNFYSAIFDALCIN